MLTDSQKSAIKAEEIFREEVRRKIREEGTRSGLGDRCWSVLNSSFFLWAMSSVVVAAISFFYQENAASRAQRAAQQEVVRRLDAELSSRLFFFGRQLLSGAPEKEAFDALNNPALTAMASGVFSEYANRTLRGLLWELLSHVPAAEQDEVKYALAQCDNLAKVYFVAKDEKLLVANSTIDVRVGDMPELDDFFGDLDRAASPAKPVATANAEHPKEERPKSGGKPRNIHFVVTLLDSHNPVLRAFSIKRWNRPFAELQDEWLEQLKVKDPDAYRTLTETSTKVGSK